MPKPRSGNWAVLVALAQVRYHAHHQRWHAYRLSAIMLTLSALSWSSSAMSWFSSALSWSSPALAPATSDDAPTAGGADGRTHYFERLLTRFSVVRGGLVAIVVAWCDLIVARHLHGRHPTATSRTSCWGRSRWRLRRAPEVKKNSTVHRDDHGDHD